MGTVTLDSAESARKYGVLAVRFNTLRSLYGCIREAINTGEDPDGCLPE